MGGLSTLETYIPPRRRTLSAGEEIQLLKVITTSGKKISAQAPSLARSPIITLNNGREMPALGLGTCEKSTKKGEIKQVVCDAIDTGYRHLNCAWNCTNEEEIGAAIKEKINEGVVKRKDLFIVSKLWSTFHHPDLVKIGLQQSLERLGLDYLDLFLIHFPMECKESGHSTDLNGNVVAIGVDISDSWSAMEMLVQKGLVKSIGVSNFSIKQLERILEMCSIPPSVVQMEVHPYFSNTKLVEFCQSRNIQVTACSSLNPCHQLLKGEPSFHQNPILLQIADQYDKSVMQVILRWVLQRNISIVPKSVSKHLLAENFDIFDFHLNDEDMSVIYGMNRNFQLSLFLENTGIQRVSFNC